MSCNKTVDELRNDAVFCPVPFIHAHVTSTNKRGLCCLVPEPDDSMKKIPLKDFWNSDYMRSVRLKMLNGERLTECQRCYEEENLGIHSARLNYLKYLLKQETLDNITDNGEMLVGPTYFDYRTILCNLKCISCGENNSSSIAVMQNKMYSHKPYVNTHDPDFDKVLGSEISESLINRTCTNMYWAGGEPMMSPVHWDVIETIDQLSKLEEYKRYLSGVYMFYSTNLTKVTHKNISIPETLGKLNTSLNASIDGVEETFEFTRDGACWPEARANFEMYYDQLSNRDYSKVSIATVISAPVIFDLQRFLEFVKNYDVTLSSFRLQGDYYNFLDIRNFHDDVKIPALTNAISLARNYTGKIKGIEALISILESYLGERYDLSINKLQTGKWRTLKRDQFLSRTKSYGDLLKLLNTDAYNWYNSI